MTIWTLDDGLQLVRALQPASREYGYHLALGGGVLNMGESEKDLDLYFLPLENPSLPKADPQKLVEWLEGLWGRWSNIGEDYGYEDDEIYDEDGYDSEGRYRPTRPTFHTSAPSAYARKLKFMRGGTGRIDVFVMQGLPPQPDTRTPMPEPPQTEIPLTPFPTTYTSVFDPQYISRTAW